MIDKREELYSSGMWLTGAPMHCIPLPLHFTSSRTAPALFFQRCESSVVPGIYIRTMLKKQLSNIDVSAARCYMHGHSLHVDLKALSSYIL